MIRFRSTLEYPPIKKQSILVSCLLAFTSRVSNPAVSAAVAPAKTERRATCFPAVAMSSPPSNETRHKIYHAGVSEPVRNTLMKKADSGAFQGG